MDNILQGVVSGIALGGLVAVMFEANQMAMKAIWRTNVLAAQTALDIFIAPHERANRDRARELAEQMRNEEREAAPQAQTEQGNTAES